MFKGVYFVLILFITKLVPIVQWGFVVASVGKLNVYALIFESLI